MMLILDYGVIFWKVVTILKKIFFDFIFMVYFLKSETIYKIFNFITQWSFYYIYTNYDI